MSTSRYESSIVINRPIEEVYSTATCLESCINWQTFLTDAEKISEGPAGVGTRYKHRARFMGLIGEGYPTITVMEPPYRFAYNDEMSSFRFHVEMNFEPVEGGTRMTAVMTLPETNGAVLPIALSFLMKAMHRQYDSDLLTLKEMMEGGMKVRKW